MTMMNRRSLLAAGCAAAALSCAPAALLAAAPAYQMIRPEEARRMMERGGVVVLDVRTPEEFATGHIKGAVNVPVDAIRPGMRLPFAPNMRARRSSPQATATSTTSSGSRSGPMSSSVKSRGRFASYYKCRGSAQRALPFLRYDFGVFTNREGKPPCTHAF